MRGLAIGGVIVSLVATILAEEPRPATASIRRKAGPSDIVITTTPRLAGAIHSLTWNGKEFIDSFDHGRQLQSASSFADDLTNYGPETFNPTEAGSAKDGAGPKSTSELLYSTMRGAEWISVTRPAFWLAPGMKDAEGRTAKNRDAVSDHLISKHVTIGYKTFDHVLDYRVTFTVPPTESHRYAQFEALTGYMPAEFSKFWTLDVTTNELHPLTDGPGEQSLPVVFSTPDEKFAMGVWSPDQPSKGYESAGYGRFRFASEKVVKWNCVFRLRDQNGVRAGSYSYQMFVAVGTLRDVRDALVGVRNFLVKP